MYIIVINIINISYNGLYIEWKKRFVLTNVKLDQKWTTDVRNCMIIISIYTSVHHGNGISLQPWSGYNGFWALSLEDWYFLMLIITFFPELFVCSCPGSVRRGCSWVRAGLQCWETPIKVRVNRYMRKKHKKKITITFSIHLLCIGSGHNVSKIIDL